MDLLSLHVAQMLATGRQRDLLDSASGPAASASRRRRLRHALRR